MKAMSPIEAGPNIAHAEPSPAAESPQSRLSRKTRDSGEGRGL